jgi:predicted Fe-Mo cluster-binding NifX family protein
MKLAIPVKVNRDNPPVAPLFGKAKWFAIVENGKVASIIPNKQLGGQAVIELLYEMKIDVILIQEMGINPYEKIKEYGTMVLYHTGFERILLNDVLEKFNNNELEILDDTNMNEIIKHHEKRHSHNHN